MTESQPDKNALPKKRWVYVLLFSMPALLASLIISALIFGATAGILWLFIVGDNPWPASANIILTLLLVFVFMALWITFMTLAYIFGKKQEADAKLNTRHVMHSIRATAVLALFVVVYQSQVGNIGQKSQGVMCADYCQAKGFSASSLSPRDAGAMMCSCNDNQGVETVKASIGEVMLEQRQ